LPRPGCLRCRLAASPMADDKIKSQLK
jgi:hypothetical protein